MSNDFYTVSGTPATRSLGVSSSIRSEYVLIQSAFDKLPALTANGLKVIRVNAGATALEVVAVSGTGSVAMTTSPTFVTPTLGAATATSINGVNYTGTAGKTFTVSNTLTITGTDGSTLNIGTGGTLGTAAYTASSAYAAVNATFNLGTTALALNRASAGVALTGITSIDGNAATVTTNANLTGPITSVGNTTSVASQTGTGTKFVMDTSPTLVTPTLGVATATSVNKMAITAPASGSTLAVADGKTLTCSNTLTFTGIDSSSVNVGAGGFMPTHIMEFRLSAQTGVAVPVSDQTSSTIYMTPYTGTHIGLYTGSGWVVRQTNEISLAVPAVAGAVFDVWCFDNAGTPTLETTQWTSDTARATALTTQDGVYVKTGSTTRRYIGTIRTTGGNQVFDGKSARWLWNMYNRVIRTISVFDNTLSWTYSLATIRQARATAANHLEVLCGLAEDAVQATVLVSSQNSSSAGRAVGIGLDSTTTFHADCVYHETDSATPSATTATLNVITGVGLHSLNWNEISVAVGTTTWFGSAAAGTTSSGIIGTCRC